MRPFRLLAGGSIVAFALWAIFSEQMTGASANAVVNARLVDLRSPTAGTLTLPDRALGAAIATGEELGRVVDPLVDSVRLNDITLERDKARADAQAVATLRDWHSTQNGQMTPETAAQVAAATDALRPALAEPVVPLADGETAADEETDTPMAIPLPRAAQDWGLDWAREQARLDSEATRLAAHAAALDARLDAAQIAVNRQSGGAMISPVNGQLWDILQSNGITVQRGDPILRLADCGPGLVTLSVTERVYNRLTIGQAATFRLEGDATLHAGTVARMAGSGAEGVYARMAVSAGPRHLERYDVLLSVPSLGTDAGSTCHIGHTGRVFFDERPLDWVRDLFRG